MIRLAICDDMRMERQIIENELTRYLSERNLSDQFQVDVYSDPHTLIRKCTVGPYDLFLLDVLMPGMTGIETAKELKEMIPEAQFIFITTTSEFLMDAFTVKALYYLLKPYSSADFDEAMDRAKNYFLGEEKQYLEILTGDGKTHKIEASEIIYSQADSRQVKVITKDGSLNCAGQTADSIRKMLSADTFVVSGPYVFNLENIRRMKDGVLTLRNGENINLSKDQFQLVREKFIEYYDS